MRLAKLLFPLLALVVSACGGGPRPLGDFAPLPPRETARPATPRPPPAHNAAIPPAPAGPLLVARVGDYMDGLESQLRHHLRGVLVARQGDVLNVVIPNSALFSDDGGVSGDDVLEPLAAILRSYPHAMAQVNGFTDTSGTPQQNLVLSQKRARLIADALVHEGVAAARLSAEGFGQTHLRIATGDNRKEPRNRRIEIVLKAKPG